MDKKIEKILLEVEKPARYIGSELNSFNKDWDKSGLKVALGYPDVYEIGMSNLGLLILYELINRWENWLCERFFVPGADLKKILLERKIPLFSLESQKNLKDFDLVGFSLQTELNYTNIMEILELARIPFRGGDREENFPLIFAGGSVAANPEPVADFFDFFVLGEAEDSLPEILITIVKNKEAGRTKILRELAQIDGVYVPSFYDVSYKKTGEIQFIKPNIPEAKFPVKKRIFEKFSGEPLLTRPLVPFIETVHDRANLEIMRGCPGGCRFCQAGYIYRPVRFKSKELILPAARELIKNTGYSEMSLLSLSSCDFPGIEDLTAELGRLLSPLKISLALPSVRVDKFNYQIGQQAQLVRKTGVTLVPEAGSQRLRKIIHKNVTEEDIMKSVEAALQLGLQRIKLYFMLGLPGETMADLEALVALVYKVLAATRGRRFSSLAVSVSTFIPKPQTPFQWVPFLAADEIESRQNYLKKNLRHSKIKLQLPHQETSLLEAILSRGDRRLSRVIELAYRGGARMDAWTEFFKWDLWRKAFQDSGLEIDFYTTRQRLADEILPWDHIDFGPGKKILLDEWQQAEKLAVDDGPPRSGEESCL